MDSLVVATKYRAATLGIPILSKVSAYFEGKREISPLAILGSIDARKFQ